jgi:response regulator RpfG family c-di-GMP phosphodiesterase
MSHRHKVLIVDDEPLNVKLLAAKLPPDQYATIPAYNGEEALRDISLCNKGFKWPADRVPGYYAGCHRS